VLAWGIRSPCWSVKVRPSKWSALPVGVEESLVVQLVVFLAQADQIARPGDIVVIAAAGWEDGLACGRYLERLGQQSASARSDCSPAGGCSDATSGTGNSTSTQPDRPESRALAPGSMTLTDRAHPCAPLTVHLRVDEVPRRPLLVRRIPVLLGRTVAPVMSATEWTIDSASETT